MNVTLEAMTMTEITPVFLDQSGQTPQGPDIWPAIVVPRASIEREIERLADLPATANGRRATSIVHPAAVAPGLGIAPGTDTTINLVKTGEEPGTSQRNVKQLDLGISGTVTVEDKGEKKVL